MELAEDAQTCAWRAINKTKTICEWHVVRRPWIIQYLQSYWFAKKDQHARKHGRPLGIWLQVFKNPPRTQALPAPIQICRWLARRAESASGVSPLRPFRASIWTSCRSPKKRLHPTGFFVVVETALIEDNNCECGWISRLRAWKKKTSARWGSRETSEDCEWGAGAARWETSTDGRTSVRVTRIAREAMSAGNERNADARTRG